MVGIHSDAVQAFQLDTIHHKIALRQRNDLLVDLNESDLPQGQASPIAQLIMADRKLWEWPVSRMAGKIGEWRPPTDNDTSTAI